MNDVALSDNDGARIGDPERRVASATITLVVGPYTNHRRVRSGEANQHPSKRSFEARIEEAIGLAQAIDLHVSGSVLAVLSEVRPATYLGKGKVEEIAQLVKESTAALVVMDCGLSPVQQRNLEKAFGAKVIDRTGLILEIFGRRARTREGTLQVELAHLSYQKSRLVRSWTHLERQRGGFGFLGGPGETQIETDRRLIQERMVRIEKDLEGVKKTRALHRKTRRDVPYPIVALVGYTNAGKSTLFNRLTQADVVAADMLFATLDPTLRGVRLPHGSRAIVSDTVGFVSDLPTMLVSAFRATLEEVIEADIILHVRDVAHEDADAQASDVEAIMQDLGIAPRDERRIIEVWNKIDLVAAERRESLVNSARRRHASPSVSIISAANGDGLEALRLQIEERLTVKYVVSDLSLEAADGPGLHWLYEHGEVLERHDGSDGTIRLAVRVAPERQEQLTRRFPSVQIRQDVPQSVSVRAGAPA